MPAIDPFEVVVDRGTGHWTPVDPLWLLASKGEDPDEGLAPTRQALGIRPTPTHNPKETAMRVNTLIASAALVVAATGALLAGLASPAAAEPTKPFGGMTQTDLKLFCQKNGGEYKGIEYGEGWYTCKLPNGYLIYCKAGTCQISRLEPESTTPTRGPVVLPSTVANATN